MKVETARAVVDKAYRERLAAWLALHDINPDEVPIHATIKINQLTHKLTVEVFARDKTTGNLVVENDHLVIKTVTVPLRTMPPKDARR